MFFVFFAQANSSQVHMTFQRVLGAALENNTLSAALSVFVFNYLFVEWLL